MRFLKAQDAYVVPALVAWELWKGASTAASQAAVHDLLATSQVESFSPALAQSAGTLHREMERLGRRRPAIDLLIAAHALHHGSPLATLDRDYDGIPGLDVVKVRN